MKTLPFLSIVQATKGQYEVSIEGEEHRFVEECGCFIAPAGVVQDIIHHLPKDGGQMEARWVFLDISALESIDLFRLMEIPRFITHEQALPFGCLLEQLLELEQAGDSLFNAIGKQRIAFTLLNELCSISVENSRMGKLLHDMSRISPALKRIESGLEDPPAVTELAGSVSLSVPRFHVLFKEITGVTPGAYIQSQRLSRSCKLLITTHMSLGQIAEATGFCDQFYFSRAFKARYKMNPMKYRALYREQHP